MKKICFVLTLFVVSLSLLTTPAYADNSWNLTSSITATYSNKTLTISGTGAMPDYNNKDQIPWKSQLSEMTTLVVNEGITHISANAFNMSIPFQTTDITNSLSSVYIHSTITSIGDNAFKGCNNLTSIHASSPNDWAGIEFITTNDYCYSHPFCASTGDHHFYFYGSNTETTILVFLPGLTSISAYAFYNANKLTSINIPHSVTNIGKKAFICNSVTSVTINNTTPPTAPEDAFKISSTSSTIYLPQNASSSYKAKPWYDSSYSGKGAKYIGTSDTDNTSTSTGNNLGSPHKVYPLSGTVDGKSWTLDNDGVLTINGSGAFTTTQFKITVSESTPYPWCHFRYLINKVVITGGITDLRNILQRCQAVKEIEIQQSNIPSATAAIYQPIYSDKPVLRLSLNQLESFDALATLWKDMNYSLSEIAYIEDSENNTDILNLLKTKLSAPFTANLSRSLKDISFNSFCSPVPMTAEQVQSVFGAGTEIYTLTNSSYNESENNLYINLSDNQTSIEAGKPYIIKPAYNEPTITIDNVNPEDIATAGQTILTDAIDFHGLLNPYTLVSGDKFLVVSANNKLNWTTSGTMKGMRSYFTLKSGIPARALSARASFVFPNNSPEAVNNVSNAQQTIQKVMRNGQLVIIRDGVTYNTMGQVIE